MPITEFEHINVRSTDVERARDFYVGVLGLRAGDRPPFASIGYWLYLGDRPIVHLVQRAPGEGGQAGSGTLDHVAFRGEDLGATRAALHEHGVPFRESIVPRDGTIQLFVHDPDGLKLELNFSGTVAEASRV